MNSASPKLTERAISFVATQGPSSPAELARHVFGGEGFEPLLARLAGDRLTFDGSLWRLPPLPADLAFLEILASGPNPSRHRIVEVAAFRQGQRFQALIHSARPTPRLLTRLGIPGHPNSEAPEGDETWLTLDEAALALRQFLAGTPVAGFGYVPAFLDALLGPAWPAIDLPRLLFAVSDFSDRPDPVRVAKRLGLAPPASRRPLAMLPFSMALLERLKAGRSRDELLALGAPRVAPAPTCPSLPNAPGVYVMSTEGGEALYVGKSVDLRRRVRGYLGSPIALSRNMDHLLHLAKRIEVIPVDSELEALLLESRLITAWKPAFNIQRLNHLPARYLRLTVSDAFPRLTSAARPMDDGSTYFGPFRHAAAAGRLRLLVGSLLRLRTCARRLPSARKPKPACARAAGSCLAPCIPGPPASSYARETELARRLLSASPEEFRRTVLGLLAERPPSQASALRLKRLLRSLALTPAATAGAQGATSRRAPGPGGPPDGPGLPANHALEPAAGNRQTRASLC